jgi:hypothetical protein
VTLLVLLALLEGGDLIVEADDDALPAGGGVAGQLVLRAAGRKLFESAGEFLVGAGGLLPVGAGAMQLHVERFGRWHGRCGSAVVTGGSRWTWRIRIRSSTSSTKQIAPRRSGWVGVSAVAYTRPLVCRSTPAILLSAMSTAPPDNRGASRREASHACRADGGIISANAS